MKKSKGKYKPSLSDYNIVTGNVPLGGDPIQERRDRLMLINNLFRKIIAIILFLFSIFLFIYFCSCFLV